MAELNLKQIIDRLNTEFIGKTRKLVFWYDDKAEFEEDMDSVELENAKVYKLENKLLPEVVKEQLTEAGVLLESIIDYKIVKSKLLIARILFMI